MMWIRYIHSLYKYNNPNSTEENKLNIYPPLLFRPLPWARGTRRTFSRISILLLRQFIHYHPRQRFDRFRHLPFEQKRELRGLFEKMSKLDRAERRQFLNNLREWRELRPEQREQLRERFKQRRDRQRDR